MKLITKVTLLYVFLLLVSLIIAGLITFQKVKDSVRRETDFELRYDARLAVHSIKHKTAIEALQNRKIQIHEISMDLDENKKGVFTDTLVFHRFYKTMETFRKLTLSQKVNGKHYVIVVTNIFFEEEDMLNGVVGTMLRLFLILSTLLFIFSTLLSRWLFAPFHSTLSQLKKFDIRKKSKTEFSPTSTKEFKELNGFVEEMINKARKDYTTLKEFTENASHEMQTPLAVIQGKLELLQESVELKENEHKLIVASQKSLTKLTKLGQSLSLLTKLENHEFSNVKSVNFSDSVVDSVAIFKELAAMRNISFSADLKEAVILKIDDSLADILINNVIKNAVHHNIDNGWIEVVLTKNKMQIQNSGLAPVITTRELMQRFRKSNQSSTTLGLGLAIVKKICDLNNWEISYEYHDEIHDVVITFGDND